MDHAIEAEETQSVSGDSGYSESLCSTESLRSSVFAYESENGRTYHAFHAGKYNLPNDEGEKERLDLQYHSMRLSIEDKMFHAPLEAPLAVLDVGTGTGIWAMDMADDNPACEVIGFDLSPIQPTVVPPNLTFEIMDADEEWGYGQNRFDLVHTRFMNGFSIKDWRHFYAEAFAALKPGGWVENQEFDCVIACDDGSLPEDSQLVAWVTQWEAGIQKVGMTARCYPEKMMQYMREAGFVNVHAKPYKMPIGPWPKNRHLKQAGVYGMVALLSGIDGLSVRVYCQLLGWSLDELTVFLTGVKKECKTKAVHSYWPLYVVMGQKPADTAAATMAATETSTTGTTAMTTPPP